MRGGLRFKSGHHREKILRRTTTYEEKMAPSVRSPRQDCARQIEDSMRSGSNQRMAARKARRRQDRTRGMR